MKKVWVAVAFLSLIASNKPAHSGPLDFLLTPSPQEFSNTCQSYAMAIGVSLQPGTPFQANTATELRELERRIRQALESSALRNNRPADRPIRDDWRAAVEGVTNNTLTVEWRQFPNLDPALRFVAEKTGIENPEGLGTALAVALVQTPVFMSFDSVESSVYANSHIVTVLGVQLPTQSMGDNATPKMLLVNSAVKYGNNTKNICASEDLSDRDRYRALTSLSNRYFVHRFGGSQPYLVTWIKRR